MSTIYPFVLASQSPRRRDLLNEAGVVFEVVSADADEIHESFLPMEKLCMVNALEKARAGARLRPDALVLGADTLVFLDGEPLGKPKDLDDARAMLRRLAGRTHTVCTGCALVSPREERTFAVATEVTFHPYTDEEIEHYISVVHVLDKAGSYAYQGNGSMIVASTKGDTNNVIGLPVAEVLRIKNEMEA